MGVYWQQCIQLLIMKENSKVIVRQEKYRPYEGIILPIERCQVCLSRTDFQEANGELPDKLVKCTLCLSSIHQKHYGGELYSAIPEDWHCERCQHILAHPGTQIIQCQFCLDIKGIMKTIEFQKKKVWAHLQCIIWDYPIKVFTCHKMVHAKKLQKSQTPFDKFWYPQITNPKCGECNSNYGDMVKCRYYTCESHYHVSCARQLGVIRELEQMRVLNHGEHTYVPVLCPEHLQKRGTDFRMKANKALDKESNKYITNLARIYEKQYSQLLKSAKEELKQMNFLVHYRENDDGYVGMEVEEVVEPSEETPIGEQSVYSERLVNFLETEMKGVFDDMKFNSNL